MVSRAVEPVAEKEGGVAGIGEGLINWNVSPGSSTSVVENVYWFTLPSGTFNGLALVVFDAETLVVFRRVTTGATALTATASGVWTLVPP